MILKQAWLFLLILCTEIVMHTPTFWTAYVQRIFVNDEYLIKLKQQRSMTNGAIKYVGKGTQNTKKKQDKKFQYLRIYNLEKIWSRIHQVFGPEFTWSRKYLVPN